MSEELREFRDHFFGNERWTRFSQDVENDTAALRMYQGHGHRVRTSSTCRIEEAAKHHTRLIGKMRTADHPHCVEGFQREKHFDVPSELRPVLGGGCDRIVFVRGGDDRLRDRRIHGERRRVHDEHVGRVLSEMLIEHPPDFASSRVDRRERDE